MTERTCSVPGCERPHDARGLCRRHYKRAAREGTLPPKAPPMSPVRFWEFCRPDRGCLVWTGAHSSGYGSVQWEGRRETAHRVAFLLRMGRWPAPGMHVRHLCGNPLCVLHTLEGTPHDNAMDRYASGTMRHAQKTHCVNGHEFTPVNTRTVTTAWGTVNRHCRQCTRDRSNAYKQRKKLARRDLIGAVR